MDVQQAVAYIEDVNLDLEKLSNEVEQFLDAKDEAATNEDQLVQFLLKLKSNFEAQARLAAMVIPPDAIKAQDQNDHTGSSQAEAAVNWEDLTPQQRLRQKLKDKVAKYGGIPALGAGMPMPRASPALTNKLHATGTSAAVEIFTSKVGAEPEFVQKLAHRRQNEDAKHEPSEMEKLRANLKSVDKPKDFSNDQKKVTADDMKTDKESAIGNELAAVLAKKRNQEK
eukprot:TRINITY_DN4523_c3_g1_i2.p1 TRINITY_DN4523_c3_g1~~TRINITY_DN4523_c3_g1_i2.p1  ORF type:complete len:264 (+),score=43.13 TRINITY_DN4523_c3_g1_i2:117-794(+)